MPREKNNQQNKTKKPAKWSTEDERWVYESAADSKTQKVYGKQDFKRAWEERYEGWWPGMSPTTRRLHSSPGGQQAGRRGVPNSLSRGAGSVFHSLCLCRDSRGALSYAVLKPYGRHWVLLASRKSQVAKTSSSGKPPFQMCFYITVSYIKKEY